MSSSKLSDQITVKLDRFASSRKEPKRKPEWSPPQLIDLAAEISILALDQSLGATGWAELTVRRGDDGNGSPKPFVDINAHGTVKTSSPHVGHLGTLHQMRMLTTELKNRLLMTSFPWTVLVCEQPPVSGHRKESSLLAAAAVELAASGTQVMVQAQHAKHVFTGDHNATKAMVRDAMATYAPETLTRKWNEHTRDALLLGLTYLRDLTHDIE